jgi:hypothetical protein
MPDTPAPVTATPAPAPSPAPLADQIKQLEALIEKLATTRIDVITLVKDLKALDLTGGLGKLQAVIADFKALKL